MNEFQMIKQKQKHHKLFFSRNVQEMKKIKKTFSQQEQKHLQKKRRTETNKLKRNFFL